MGKFNLTSTRFIVTCSVAVLTVSSIIGAMLYMKAVRPTLFGESGSSGKIDALPKSFAQRLKLVKQATENESHFIYTSNEATDAETQAEDEGGVDAQEEIKLIKASQRDYGTAPPSDLSISEPAPPEAKEKMDRLTAIPHIIPAAISITQVATRSVSFSSYWSKSEGTIKAFKVQNIFKRQGFTGMIILFTKKKDILERFDPSDRNLVAKFDDIESIKSLLSEFSPSSAASIYDQTLPDDYEILQSDSAETAKALTKYFTGLITGKQKEEMGPSLVCIAKESLFKRNEDTHVAILMNNRINVGLETISIEGNDNCP